MTPPPPRSDLNAALAEADLRVLIMVLHHLTGDDKWLSDRYRPARDVNLIADEDAGFSPEVQAEIRAEAARLLVDPPDPAITDPGPDHIVRMMRHCLSENVGTEYALMMREEMGFTPRQVVWSGAPAKVPETPVIIVGAGESGMIAGANLQALGIPYVIIEERDEVGGTWLVNTYPGCAVDTPNHAYSFSFGSRYPWTRFFSRRDELLDYMITRSHEFGIRDKIRFNTRVIACDWDEAAGLWQISLETPNGTERLSGWALISAIGPISRPHEPNIPGWRDFDGPIFHANRWPPGIEIEGKRVAIVGTGASSMQIVPSIVDRVQRLTVFQRTAQWVRHIPRFQDEMSEATRWLLEHVPFYVEWFRFTMLWRYGDGLLRTLKRDPDWPHPERSMNRINDRHRIQMTEFIEAELEGRPDLLEKCLPDYPPYAKRILLDNGWYQALRKPNCTLVTDGIERIERDGVRATDGTLHKADVVLLAIGFQVFLNAAALNVTGRDGRRLDHDWAGEDPKAHLGITAPGFPNLFFLQGPNTVLAHGGSAIFTSECQARYAVAAIARMLEDGIGTIDVRPEIQDAYMSRVDAAHRDLVWAHPGMKPWYRNAKGRVAAAIPWRLVDYHAMTHDPDFAEFRTTRATNP